MPPTGKVSCRFLESTSILCRRAWRSSSHHRWWAAICVPSCLPSFDRPIAECKAPLPARRVVVCAPSPVSDVAIPAVDVGEDIFVVEVGHKWSKDWPVGSAVVSRGPAVPALLTPAAPLASPAGVRAPSPIADRGTR